jgi:hypothetical protein
MECGYEHREFKTNFGENGENHLFLLFIFISPASFELRQQILVFCKEILEIVEDFWSNVSNSTSIMSPLISSYFPKSPSKVVQASLGVLQEDM